jgi:hypothetical protein
MVVCELCVPAEGGGTMNRFAEVAAGVPHGGAICWRQRIDPMLTAKQRKELDEAIADPEISGEVISRVLRSEWNLNIGGQAVRKHRNRACQCQR